MSIPITTLSFYFRNVVRNVDQCCSVCPSLLLLYHSTSEMLCAMLINVVACVHPYYYSIILLQKCYAQCWSILQRVSIPITTLSFYFSNVARAVACNNSGAYTQCNQNTFPAMLRVMLHSVSTFGVKILTIKFGLKCAKFGSALTSGRRRERFY